MIREHPGVALAKASYVHGHLDIAGLEKALELPLLHDAGRAHPVPPGWEPLPECRHETWYDATALGDPGRPELCADCGDTRWSVR